MNTGLPCATLTSDRSVYIGSLLDRNVQEIFIRFSSWHCSAWLHLPVLLTNMVYVAASLMEHSWPIQVFCDDFVPIEVRPLFGCLVDNDDLGRWR